MAWETGTAVDHNDLLNKLGVFLGANGWTVHENVTFQHPPNFSYYSTRPVDDGIDERRLIAEAPGKPGMASSLIAVETAQVATNSTYLWALGAPVSYEAGLSLRNQPGAVPQNDQVFYSLWNSNMTYWFVANQGRVIVIALVSTRVMFAYLGHGVPFSAPSEAPNPQIVAGTSDFDHKPYSDPTISCLPGLLPDNGNYGAHVVRSGGAWQDIAESQYRSFGDPGAGCYKTVPYRGFWAGDDDNGEAYLYPVGLAFNGGLAMLVEGVYMVKAEGAAPGSVITVNGTDYVVGINVAQDNRSNRYAVELS